MVNWEKTNQFYINANVPFNKSREQIAYEKWLRRVTDRNGNFRVSKEDGLERPIKIVNSIIRIREDIDKSEGYIVSKQTHKGLTAFLDEVPISVNHSECYVKPTFRYQHRQTRNEEVEDIENLPTGEGRKQIIYTIPYNEEGKEYMDELMTIASPRITFYVCQTGRITRAIPVRTYEDLKNKKFADLMNPKYWADYEEANPNVTVSTRRKIVAPAEVVA